MIARDVGGNFGTRNAFYPEFALVAWAARRLGRPVKWTCERHEALPQRLPGPRPGGRGRARARRATAISWRCARTNTSNVGAHTVIFVPLDKGVELMTERLPHPGRARARARGRCSNTPPTNPYRSAGRPEAMFVIERLIDLAAHEHGFDRDRAAPAQPDRRARRMPYANAARPDL